MLRREILRHLTAAMNILEFSQRAGVSTATVSRAFHEPQKLRQDTRDTILSLAAELGYYPSPSGRALKRGRHDVLGAIWPLEVEGAEAEFAQRILAALSRHLVANDLDLLLCPVDRNDPATLSHARRTLQRSRCDAWILLYPRREDPLIEALLQSGKPVVCLMGRLPGQSGWKSVCLDQEKWIADALGRLRKSGCKSVLLFGGREGEPDHEERRQAFRRLAAKRFPGKWSLLESWPPDPAALQDRLQTELIDGVIGIDDRSALVALEACRNLDLGVPDKVRIVGIDDLPRARFSRPPLSTYRQPLDEMAGCAVEIALGLRLRSKSFEAAFVARATLT